MSALILALRQDKPQLQFELVISFAAISYLTGENTSFDFLSQKDARAVVLPANTHMTEYLKLIS